LHDDENKNFLGDFK